MYRPSGIMRMTQAANALLLLLLVGTVDAQGPAPASHLHLQITRDGNFEVLSSRVKSGDSTIALMLFGVIGFGLATTMKHASDTELEQQAVPDAGAATCRYAFEQALNGHLQNNGFLIETERDKKLPVLEIAIVACGFRPLDRTSGEMSAFFESKFRFTQAGARRSKTPQHLFETGRLRAAWSEFENSPALAADELHRVLSRAGRKLANKIVYAHQEI